MPRPFFLMSLFTKCLEEEFSEVGCTLTPEKGKLSRDKDA
jgi:hypothetical protein